MASKGGDSKTGGSDDDGAFVSMKPNKLTVQPAPPGTPAGSGMYCGMHADKLAELRIHEGDYVLIRGSQGLKAICVAMSTGEDDGVLAPGEIFLNDMVRLNVKKLTSDTVTVAKVAMVAAGIGGAAQAAKRAAQANLVPAVEIVVATSKAQVPTDDDPSVFVDKLVRPYFAEGYGLAPSGRAVYEGQLIKCGTIKKGLFKVLQVKTAWTGKKVSKKSIPSDAKFGMVHAQTVITLAPFLKDKDLQATLKKTGYADIGGLKKELKKIRELVELPIRHPKLFTSIGVKPPKGVLMHGPPGTGKTLIARAIANEVDCTFKPINGPEIIGGPKGQSEENIRKLFAEAAEEAPCIIFIDEIDALAPSRDKVQDEQMQRVVATLLTEMDGLKKNSHVMVIGATNRPNALDPALRRSGRFDAEIQIGVPSEQGRLEILQILTKEKMRLEGAPQKKDFASEEDPEAAFQDATREWIAAGSPAVSLEEIARKTHGYVGADLQIACTKAAVRCIRERAGEGDVDIEAEKLPQEFYQSLNVTQQHFDKAIKNTPASAMKEFVVEIPNVSFADIGGLEDVKSELREMIEFPVNNPEYFEELGIQPPKGALLYGPPGCGKTLLAKAMANQCSCNFISVKGPQLLSKWVGESESNVRNVFEKARQASPCIVFFDELDSIARARGSSSGGPGIGDSVVNQLLTEMDGMAKRNHVFVIGATNRPEGLDPAIMRPGRLDQHIYVPIPDRAARRGIFTAALRKAKVHQSVDFEALTDQTDSFSGADLAALCQGAAKISVRRRKEADLAGQDTADWAIQPADFEISFRGARSSVPKEDQERYRQKKAQVGEGGVTSGIDLSSLTGRYELNQAETEAKVKREAEAAAAREAQKLARKRQKAALQSAGLSGLRSASASRGGGVVSGGAESKMSQPSAPSSSGPPSRMVSSRK